MAWLWKLLRLTLHGDGVCGSGKRSVKWRMKLLMDERAGRKGDGEEVAARDRFGSGSGRVESDCDR